MKRASLIAALCLLILPVVGLADTIEFASILPGGTVTTTNNMVGSGGVNPGDTIAGSLPIFSMVSESTNANNGGAWGIGGTLTFTGNLEDWDTSTGLGGVKNTDYQWYLTGINLSTPADTTSGYGFRGTNFTTPGQVILDMSCTPNTSGSYCTLNFGLTGPSSGAISGDTASFFNEGATTWDISGTSALSSTDACVHNGTCGSTFSLDGQSSTLYLQKELTPPPGTPEPATLSLLGVGLIGLLGIARRRS